MCDLAVELSAWIDPRFGRNEIAIPNLTGEDAAVAGEIARRDFGLGNGPVGNLVHLLEARGVRLFSLSANCREIDACSFWRDEIPYILVDMTRSSERIRFNIAHELGHLALHRHGAPVGQEAEKQANAFASSFLMPYESLRHHLRRYVTIDTILRTKSIWGVSAMALAYRLHRTGTLSEWRYKSFIIEMRRRDYHVTEPHPIAHEESFVLKVVLETLKKRQISLRRVAEETYLPHSEVVGLLEGLASTAIAQLDAASAEERRSNFRVI